MITKNLLIILIMSHINAMEQPSLTCLFTRTSTDIMNYIATFLDDDDIETEQEFIKRTKTNIPQELPQSYTNLLPVRQFGMALNHGYSPNAKYIALLQSEQKEVLYVMPRTSQKLFIINKEKNNLIHNTTLDDKGYKNIAISNDAHIIATTHLETDTSGDLCTDTTKYKTMITIKNIRNNKAKKFEFHRRNNPWNLNCHAIFFNKQGTHLIAHYTKYNNGHHPIKEHQIIPFTPQKKMITIKTLENYFAQKKVCKNIMEQIKEGDMHVEHTNTMDYV